MDEGILRTKKMKAGAAVVGLVLAAIILFVSFARASLITTIRREKENKLGKIPVRLLTKNDNGGVELCFYYLPEVRTLPVSPFYKIKKIRDYFWISFCREKNEKAKMALLLADKKIAESQILFINGYPEMAMVTAKDGVEKLIYAGWLWDGLEKKGRVVLGEKIYMAGLAYEKVLARAKGAADVDQKEYEQVIKQLNDWNEKQKKKID